MSDWLRRYAVALGEEPLSNDEVAALLELARDVAHNAQRQFAPLSTFLAGVYAARSTFTDGVRPAAVTDAVEVARRLLDDGGGTSDAAGATAAGGAASATDAPASAPTAPPGPRGG